MYMLLRFYHHQVNTVRLKTLIGQSKKLFCRLKNLNSKSLLLTEEDLNNEPFGSDVNSQQHQGTSQQSPSRKRAAIKAINLDQQTTSWSPKVPRYAKYI